MSDPTRTGPTVVGSGNDGGMTDHWNRRRDDWLHGWPRMGDRVLIGTGLWCVGCGADGGLATVIIPEDWEKWTADRPMPTWPFDEADCPVCELRDRLYAEPLFPEPPPWPKGKPRPLP